MGINDNLTSREAIESPHSYFGEIRETAPVYWNDKWGGWIVTSYDAVKECLQDNQHLSVEAKSNQFKEGHEHAKDVISQWMVVRDPPEHTRLRRLTTKVFTARAVEELRPTIEEISQSKIDEFKRNAVSEIDFLHDYAYPLPLKVICRMLGIPRRYEDDVKRWSGEIILVIQQHYEKQDRYERAEKSVKEFSELLQDIVKKREANPQDDLISYLIESQEEGQMMNKDEVVATAMLFLVGGHETTSNLMANGMYELLRHPEQRDKLAMDSSLAKNTVEEMLRFQSPLKAVTRSVIEDFQLGGKQINKGDKMLLSLVSANRDPAMFDDPDTFDITREPKNHLAFGAGIHFCVGAPLARLEASIAVPKFVQAFPEAELVTDDVEWEQSPVGRGLKELPVRL